MKKIILSILAVAAITGTVIIANTTSNSKSTKSCCYKGSPCCYEGSPCCAKK